jgi:hypothetical protein
MNGKTAGLLFLAISLVLAVLLITGTISFLASGSTFAAFLLVLGVLSRGFRKKS